MTFHPAFPQPESNARLWRYVDFDKFSWMVRFQKLFFPVADRLGDPLEGTAPEGTTTWWESQIEQAQSLEQRKVIQHNRKTIANFATSFKHNYFVQCWHMNDQENQEMWHSYTTTKDSVAFWTTYSCLKQQLPDYALSGEVRYLDYSKEALPSLNLFEYITHKSECYSFEKEVRVVVSAPTAGIADAESFSNMLFEREADPTFIVYAPPVDPSVLVQGVVLHPSTTAKFTTEVLDLCNKHDIVASVSSVYSQAGGAL